MGDIRLRMGISNFVINSFEYDGKDASDYTDTSFPITIRKFQTSINGYVYLKKGGVSNSNSFRIPNLQQGNLIDFYDFSSNETRSIVSDFDLKENKNNLNGINLNLSHIDITKSYLGELSAIKSKIIAKDKKNSKIERLENKIFVIDNSNDSNKNKLEQKLSVYRELAKLDSEKDYNYEINSIKEELKVYKKAKKEEKSEEEADEEIIESKKSVCERYEEVKKQYNEAQYQGQRNNLKPLLDDLELSCMRAREANKVSVLPGTNSYVKSRTDYRKQRNLQRKYEYDRRVNQQKKEYIYPI